MLQEIRDLGFQVVSDPSQLVEVVRRAMGYGHHVGHEISVGLC